LILVLGKNGSFQLINGNHNGIADQFFKYFTHYGDGGNVGAFRALLFFLQKKIFYSSSGRSYHFNFISQFLKRIVYPEELRPISYLSESFPVHQIAGVEMRRLHSFPSGHTTTAFTMALIMSHMINKKVWSILLPLLALIAAYSRVYLAQHFPTDLLAGMCIGIVSAILSLLVYKKIIRRLNERVVMNEGKQV
jgi:hypothetical protein